MATTPASSGNAQFRVRAGFSDRDARFILSKDLLVSKLRLLTSRAEATGDDAVKIIAGRRDVLGTFALTMAQARSALRRRRQTGGGRRARVDASGATHLDALKKRLAQAPRRRDFKAVPMILNSREQWDHEALTEVLAYRPVFKQAWDSIDIGGPWLSLMRNTLNTQIWSFKHPIPRCIGAQVRGSWLYDQAMWDKYQLTNWSATSSRPIR